MIKRRQVYQTEQFNCSVWYKDKINFTTYTDKFLYVEIETDNEIEIKEIMMSPEDSLKLYRMLEQIHGGK